MLAAHAIIRICTYSTLLKLAGIMTGIVINPPKPVTKPEVAHFAI